MAQEDTYYKRSEGYVWLQPEGPGTAMMYLNCAGLEGISQSEGDITLLYCKDETKAGKFRVRDSFQGERGNVTTSLIVPLGKLTNYVFSLKCQFELQVRYQKCDRPDDPTGWEKILHLSGARVTNRSTDALAARTQRDEGEVLTTVGISAEEVYEVNRVALERQATTEVNSLNDVAFDVETRCADTCGSAKNSGQNGYIVCDRTGAVSANVLRTTNGGGTWAATATDPFAVSEDISSVVYLGDRVIVSRLTADVANPAEIGYSDDNGATWTLVNVGSTNNQTLQRLFWLSKPYLWTVANSGYVYFSSDYGVTWTTQDAGVATAQNLNDIHFCNSQVGIAVGAANAMIKTTDGGNGWYAITGPAGGVVLNCVHVVNVDTYYVGAANGNLYKTTDGGTTWTTMGIAGAGVGSVTDVRFFNDSFGYVLKNTAAPVGAVQRTVDGGKSWFALTTPTNSGLNRLAIIDQNELFAVGEANGGTGVIVHGE